ncbi:tetratricopeptide repeat protein [Halocynthiibacter styelae]|uniref:Tetratricopeptide repeat protein n=1 Tax=Halocynthiibacter styelae TaxID=2761955 RepID=A0A8J7IRU0_9RHOB|nr:hypothetical protein [Paenihalocynthiibacter styelae]MBI1494346.1 hypothetical protein [Paenihalocynthiibacter styelae]
MHLASKSILLFIMFLSANGAVAENVTLRSGEHPGFSRLVLDFQGEIPDWRLGRSEEGYMLQIDQSDFTPDLSDVFRKISRRHLEQIEFLPESRSLSLTVTCSCHISAFNFRASRLVLDIKEGAANLNSIYEIPFTQLIEEPAQPRLAAQPESALPEHMDQKAAIEPSVTLQLPRSTNLQQPHSNLPPLLLSVPETPMANQDPPTPVPSPAGNELSEPRPNRDQRRAETERVLLRELERAASQGLLDAHLPDIPAPPPSVPVQMTDPEPTSARPRETGIRSHLNIDADTSIDRGVLGALAGIGVIDERLNCSLGDDLDIRTWGTESEISTGLAQQRRGLLNARDELQQPAAISLVQAYLYATFGAEASRTLDLLPKETDQIRALRQIAALSDNLPQIPDGPLPSLQNCPNAGAFWAMLTNRVVPAQGVDHDAVIEFATSLPPHLRTLYGSRLIRIYSRSGDTSRAEMLRTAIERTLEYPHPEFELAQAEINHSEGQTEEAQVILSDLIQGNSQLSLDALELFMKSALEQQTSIAPTILENAEALAFEHSGSEQGIRLQYLLARSYSQQQQLGKAIQLLQSLTGKVQDYDMKFAWEELARKLLETPSDSDFLASYYLHRNTIQNADIMVNTRRNFAERLITLGMADAGITMLDSSTSLTADDRLLHAQAAYILGDYTDALGFLEGLSGNEADMLRLKLLEKNANFKAAARLADRQQQTERASELLWRDGDWAALIATPSSPARQAAADIMLRQELPDIPPNAATGDLTSVRALLTRSQSDRATIVTIFQETELQENQSDNFISE